MAEMLMPIVFIVILCIIYLIMRGFKAVTTEQTTAVFWVKKPQHVAAEEDYSIKLSAALIRSILMILVMAYIPLCNFTLQYFNCTNQLDGSWSLDAQPSLKCYDDKHMSYLPWALWGVLVYMIGIPAIVAIILRINKDNVCILFIMIVV